MTQDLNQVDNQDNLGVDDSPMTAKNEECCGGDCCDSDETCDNDDCVCCQD